MTIGDEGKVIVGIVNHETYPNNYRLEVTINDVKVNEVDTILLTKGEKWEEAVTFTPTTVAKNQKVEFLLYKNDETDAGKSLHIWIDVSK